MSGPGGRFLNPFKRRGEPPFAFWQEATPVDAKGTEIHFTVPEYASGKIRIMAVGSAVPQQGSSVAGNAEASMQVARLSHGLETGKMGAKLRQMLLALQLEWHYSKEEILEAYFNLAPYGGNVEGLGAAAVCYFHKSAAQLAPAESAALMLVPQNPARRRPSPHNAAFTQAVRRLNSTWFGKKESAPLRVYGPQDMTKIPGPTPERHPKDRYPASLPAD